VIRGRLSDWNGMGGVSVKRWRKNQDDKKGVRRRTKDDTGGGLGYSQKKEMAMKTCKVGGKSGTRL